MLWSIDGTGANRPRRARTGPVWRDTGWSRGVTPLAREWSRSHDTAGVIGAPFDCPSNFFVYLTHSDRDRESGVSMHCIWPLLATIAHPAGDSGCSRRGRLVSARWIRKATGIHCTCTSRRGVTVGWLMAMRSCFSFLGKRSIHYVLC
jgi:hypothetical protein